MNICYRLLMALMFMVAGLSFSELRADDFPVPDRCQAVMARSAASLYDLINERKINRELFEGIENMPKSFVVEAIVNFIQSSNREMADIKRLEKVFKDNVNSRYHSRTDNTYPESGFNELGEVMIEYLKTLDGAFEGYKSAIQKANTDLKKLKVKSRYQRAQAEALAEMRRNFTDKIDMASATSLKTRTKAEVGEIQRAAKLIFDYMYGYFEQFPNARYLTDDGKSYISDGNLPL